MAKKTASSKSKTPSASRAARSQSGHDEMVMPKWFKPPQDSGWILAGTRPAAAAGAAMPKAMSVPPQEAGLNVSAMAHGGYALSRPGVSVPDATLRVLCVHGIGNHHINLAWKQHWAQTIAAGILDWRPQARVECSFLEHDHFFSGKEIGLLDVTEATARLLASGIFHGIGDLFGARGMFGQEGSVRWSAGMVAQWVANEKLRAVLRAALLARIQSDDPHVICGHSLGSLICYDTLIQGPGKKAAKNRVFVSLGSQIGNPFVRTVFDGVILSLQAEAAWFHLYNRHDDVLTAEIRIRADNFTQVEAHFDDPGMADHDAISYFAHPETSRQVWSRLAGAQPAAGAQAGARSFGILKHSQSARKRALLVGINNYPDPEMRLDGCKNDVYLASAVLQEIGFQADEIRVVFDDRATAAGIRDRLHWLLDGADAGDQRVFYYSGHGAQLETYSLGETVDRKDECLVPYDFDWSLDRAVVDDWFYELYSQLDHGVSFFTMFDCCHSGGMTRGSSARVRGIDPPDDIEHRAMRWDKDRQMWVPRALKPIINRAQAEKDRKIGGPKNGIQLETYQGAGDTGRLGRGSRSRAADDTTKKAIRKALGHDGPFQPLIYHACREGEYAWEYRHGAHAYGAFTYAMSLAVRAAAKGGKPPTFTSLLESVAARLKELDYQQTPGIFGPETVRKSAVPWLTAKR